MRDEEAGKANGYFGKIIASWDRCKRGKGANVTNSD